MKLETGNMWSIFDLKEYFLVTTNSYIRKDGALVMGRGIAKQLADKIPSIPWDFADKIKHLGNYGIVVTAGRIGAFQVKKHFANDAEFPLITSSTYDLHRWAESLPKRRFDLNFPGIGNGHLDYNEVLPLLQGLPDNVHIWTFT